MTAEVSEADTEAANVAKLIAVAKKYSRIDELTSEVLKSMLLPIPIYFYPYLV